MFIPEPIPTLLVLARVGGMVMTAPVFGHALMPVRVRLGVALALTVIVSAAVPPPAVLPVSVIGLGGAMTAEVAMGAILGVVAQFVFAGVQIGGQLAGVQMGFGFATLIDPQSHAQTTVVAELQQLLVLFLFLTLDIHHALIAALIDSFHTAPLGAVALGGAGLSEAVKMAAGLFALGLRIAAPVMMVLLLATVGLGVIARTVPQLNVFVVGFPINVGAGLFVMGAALPFTVRLLAQEFALIEPTLGRLVRGLMDG
jgi:flagellar biosynthesis protein FliR